MRFLEWVPILALALGACGAPSTTSRETTAANEAEDAAWSESLLRKLEPTLRAQVRDGGDARVAVKVHFRDIPDDEELSELLLSRVGDQVVGRVRFAELRRIAARDDVDRIEQMSDVGY